MKDTKAGKGGGVMKDTKAENNKKLEAELRRIFIGWLKNADIELSAIIKKRKALYEDDLSEGRWQNDY